MTALRVDQRKESRSRNTSGTKMAPWLNVPSTSIHIHWRDRWCSTNLLLVVHCTFDSLDRVEFLLEIVRTADIVKLYSTGSFKGYQNGRRALALYQPTWCMICLKPLEEPYTLMGFRSSINPFEPSKRSRIATNLFLLEVTSADACKIDASFLPRVCLPANQVSSNHSKFIYCSLRGS